MSYQLFETMLFQDSKIFLLKNHLTRIFYSAMYFGFKTHNLCALLEYFGILQKCNNTPHYFSNINSFQKTIDAKSYHMSFANRESHKILVLPILRHYSLLQNDFSFEHFVLEDFPDLWENYDTIITQYIEEQNNITQNSSQKCKTSIQTNTIFSKQSINQEFINKEYLFKDKRNSLKLSTKILDKEFCSKKKYIAKLILKKNGELLLQFFPYNTTTTNVISLADRHIFSTNKFLYHKTTWRKHYQKSVENITKNILFDTIYFNEKGEITEGSRSNIILKLGDKYVTPKAQCGLLRGCLNSLLLHSEVCQETILTKQDIIDAESIFCINSLRGIIKVNLLNNQRKIL